MTVVPADSPVAIPVADPIVATPGELDVHVPPVTVSVSAVADPTQTFRLPVIGLGFGFTVTVMLLKHPPGRVYLITVVPGDTAVTFPVVDPIVATPGVPDFHVPPDGVSVITVVSPTHNRVSPTIGPGTGFTVTVA